MPIIKSAIKRAKQTEVRRSRNLVTKRNLREQTRLFEDAVAAKNAKKASEQLNSLYSAIDTAVKKHLMHKNKAPNQLKLSLLKSQWRKNLLLRSKDQA